VTRPAPLTLAGRQTLIYVVFAVSGPVLTGIVIWSMLAVRDWQDAAPLDRLDKFATLALLVASALMVTVVTLACFISIRAIKIGKAGLEAEGAGGDEPPVDEPPGNG